MIYLLHWVFSILWNRWTVSSFSPVHSTYVFSTQIMYHNVFFFSVSTQPLAHSWSKQYRLAYRQCPLTLVRFCLTHEVFHGALLKPYLGLTPVEIALILFLTGFWLTASHSFSISFSSLNDAPWSTLEHPVLFTPISTLANIIQCPTISLRFSPPDFSSHYLYRSIAICNYPQHTIADLPLTVIIG